MYLAMFIFILFVNDLSVMPELKGTVQLIKAMM